MIQSFDVVVAGAGPVGLFLACELALAGVSVIVLERDTTPESQWKDGSLGRRGLNIPAVEAFYRRGMLDKLFEKASRPSHFVKTDKFQFAGHFAGIMVDANKIDFSRWKYHLPGPTFYPGPTSLGFVETLLTERATTLGVQIRRGTGVSKFIDEGEGVKMWSGEDCIETQWLVGCDGGRSFIRKAAGFDFVGTEAEFTGYVALCDLEDPEALKKGFNYTKSGMYMVAGPGHLVVVDFDLGFDRSQAITREHFQGVLQRVTGTDIAVKELRLATSFTDRSKQAVQYRKGRVLLAGDSAHIHSPLGAQGMNTGIGDAINLGWKLAATVNECAPPGLLDTYHNERHPIGEWVLEWTRAQVATLRPNLYGSAVANIMRDMIDTQGGATYFADRVWGLSQRYDLGGSHELIGCSAPDLEFEDGSHLGSQLEEGNFLVVDLKGNRSLEDYVQPLAPKVMYCARRAKETLGLEALLIRPDGIVAWATEDGVDLQSMKTALSRWTLLEPTPSN